MGETAPLEATFAERERPPGARREILMTRHDAVAFGWTALLLAACVAPARWLGLQEVSFKGFGILTADKLIHATLFAGYAFFWAMGKRGRGVTARVVSVGLALAVLTELAQALPFIRRDPDPFDTLADVTGLAIGYATAQVVMLLMRMARQRELKELVVEN